MKKHTCLILIEKAVDEKWLKYLAFYHLVKYHYRNSCIYNYKQRMSIIAKEFSICTRTLYNYLNTLKTLDLIYEHSSNLIFKSIKKIKKENVKKWQKTILNIKPHHALKDIECLLYAKIIEHRGNQQAFRESVRRANDRFKSGTNNDVVIIDESFAPSFSFRTVAKILKTSEYKAFHVIHRLNKLKIIKTKKIKPKLIKLGIPFYISDENEPYRFIKNGNLYECYGNKHSFLEYPIFLKNYSWKRLYNLKKKSLQKK